MLNFQKTVNRNRMKAWKCQGNSLSSFSVIKKTVTVVESLLFLAIASSFIHKFPV